MQPDLMSILGYRRDSPYKSNPYIDIESPNGQIDMSQTDMDLLGIDNTGQVQYMKARRKQPYKFRGNKVREIPYQVGGYTPPPVGSGHNQHVFPEGTQTFLPGDSLTEYQIWRARDQYNNLAKEPGMKRAVYSDRPAFGRPTFNKMPIIAGKNPDGSPKYYMPSDKDVQKISNYDPGFMHSYGFSPNYTGSPYNLPMSYTPDVSNLDQSQFKPIPQAISTTGVRKPLIRQQGGNIFTSQAEIDAANAYARSLATRKGLVWGENSYVARNIGDPKPVVFGNTGTQPITKQLPFSVPSYVQRSDFQTDSGNVWYTDPQTGDIVDVNPSVLNQPRFRKTDTEIQADLMARNKPLRRGGSSLSPEKAAEMLRDGTAQGHALTEKQKRYFQAIKHGWTPTRMKYESGGDIYDFLYEDEDENSGSNDIPTAPTTEDLPVDETDQQQPEENDDNDQLAMAIAFGDFSDRNPYAESDPSVIRQRQQGVNPYLKQTEQDVFSNFNNVTNFGIWGDKAHQMRKSDHNTGDAQDFGVSSKAMAQQILGKLENEAEDRHIKYMIYNGRIWNPETGWRPYKGTNSHSDHIHVSYTR